MMDIDTKKESNKIQKSNKNENSRKTNKKQKNIEEIKNKQNDNKGIEENENKNIYCKEEIKIYSYNSRGFDMIKQNYCIEILNTDSKSVPILCNQENFILKGNGHIIRKALKGYHVFIKPAVKNHMDGRPAIGMFIALPEQLRNKAKEIPTASNRVQAVLFETDKDILMIINVYFPKDPKTMSYQSDPELEEVLVTIENLIENYECNNVVITGDLNMDCDRINGRVARVKAFVDDNNFELAWNRYSVDFTHEFEVEGTSFLSTIDHFIWNRNLSQNILDAGVDHSPNNTSDHSPIYCKVHRRCSTVIGNKPQKNRLMVSIQKCSLKRTGIASRST